MVSTSRIVRGLAFLAIMTSLFVLLLGQGFGAFSFDPSGPLQGVIIFFAGLMIGVETLFTRDFPELANLSSLNVWLGVPSALIAMAVGIGFIMDINFLVVIFQPFLGGIYIATITILAYEWFTAQYGIEPSMGMR